MLLREKLVEGLTAPAVIRPSLAFCPGYLIYEMICHAVPSNILLLLSKFLRQNLGRVEQQRLQCWQHSFLPSDDVHLSGVAEECDRQFTGQKRNFHSNFPKGCQVIAVKDSSRCDGTRYHFFDTLSSLSICSPENKCCLIISSPTGKELKDTSGSCWSFSTDSSISDRAHRHIIVITEITMVTAVSNCSDIIRRCNINDGS